MNKFLLALLFGSTLSACGPTGQEFKVIAPEHPHGGPRLIETTWWVGPGVPVEKLQDAAAEWKIALSCGMNPRQVSDPTQASIKFVCGHVEEGRTKLDPSGFEMGYMSVSDNRRGSTTVILDEWCDDSIARSQALHAWGHALGYPHQLGRGDSVLDSEPINPIDITYASLGIRSEELDNIRIWALTHGAPGCGAEDPHWNWEKMPGYYSSHPDVSALVAEQMADAHLE